LLASGSKKKKKTENEKSSWGHQSVEPSDLRRGNSARISNRGDLRSNNAPKGGGVGGLIAMRKTKPARQKRSPDLATLRGGKRPGEGAEESRIVGRVAWEGMSGKLSRRQKAHARRNNPKTKKPTVKVKEQEPGGFEGIRSPKRTLDKSSASREGTENKTPGKGRHLLKGGNLV